MEFTREEVQVLNETFYAKEFLMFDENKSNLDLLIEKLEKDYNIEENEVQKMRIERLINRIKFRF